MDLPQAQDLNLSPERMLRVTGFGFTEPASADAYVYRPSTLEGIREVFALARRTGRKVALRGAGQSYGDAAVLNEAIVLELTRFNRVLSWDPVTGVMDCESGVTIEGLWRRGIEDGWWPAVVSGTMRPTLAGALGMNLHGKNAFKAGPIGEHVLDLDLMTPDGEVRTITREDPLFAKVVSSAGMLGAIVRVRIQTHRVVSGNLKVFAANAEDWDGQFALFERFQKDADYMVSWVDCFPSGQKAGRGQFHAAWYDEVPNLASLRLENQDLPDSILGFFPKSATWRILRLLNTQWGMRFVNGAKQFAGKLGHEKIHPQSLVAFSFLLDYVPNWRKAYAPDGFIQYQTFVPKEHAKRVFSEQVRLQQEAGMVSYLGVLKRHRTDRFLLSHGVDGYSLALDFKVKEREWPKLQALCHRMNELVLDAGGRFYLAKDLTLRPEDARRYLGEATLAELKELRDRFDPERQLDTAMARRLQLP